MYVAVKLAFWICSRVGRKARKHVPPRSGWAYHFAHSPQPHQPSPKGCRVGQLPVRRFVLHSKALLHERTTLRAGEMRVVAARRPHEFAHLLKS